VGPFSRPGQRRGGDGLACDVPSPPPPLARYRDAADNGQNAKLQEAAKETLTAQLPLGFDAAA